MRFLVGADDVNDQVNFSDMDFIFEYLIIFCARFAYIKNMTKS